MRRMKSMLVLAMVCSMLAFSQVRECPAGDSIPELFEESFQKEALGNYTAALNSVVRILRKDYENYHAVLRAGWLNYMGGIYEESIKQYSRAAKMAPGAIEPRLGLLPPLMALGRWDQAEKESRWILARDPGNYLAKSRLAFTLFSVGKYPEAAGHYAEILKWYPGDLDMELGLAWTNLKLGKKTEAVQLFKNVLNVRRGNAGALQGLDMAAGAVKP